nr:FHA domain-containing protein [uncultured Agathobacter sp.]
MSIICKQCGYENPDGSTICEICAEPLESGSIDSVQKENRPVKTQSIINQTATVQQVEESDDRYEYFVTCPESNTKTILPNGKVSTFYCEGCKKNHDIDDFLWVIERKEKDNKDFSGEVVDNTNDNQSGDVLWLEEVNSHFRIEIDKAGGTLGRYGKYGSEFFQSRGLLTVSGEHCIITNEFGNWVIRHISKTNQTKYNNMILGTNEPNLLENGKILTLANSVSFVVRIG